MVLGVLYRIINYVTQVCIRLGVDKGTQCGLAFHTQPEKPDEERVVLGTVQWLACILKQLMD